MGRALLWLGLGLALLLVVMFAVAPPQLGMQALLLAGVMVVPGALVLALTASARRRREHRLDEE